MKELAQYAVDFARKLGAKYAEARVQRDTGTGLVLKNGSPDPVHVMRALGIGVRVLVNGSLGFASTNDLSKGEVTGTVRTAFETAKASSKLVKHPVILSQEKMHKADWEAPCKTSAEGVELEERFQVLKDIEKAIASDSVKVSLPSRLLVLDHSVQEKFYMNSDGADVHGKVPRVSLWVFLTAVESGKGSVQRYIHMGESRGWEAVADWNPTETIANEAKMLGKILREGKRVPQGKVDVVLGSEVVGIICHESCGHPQEADRILGREAAQAGESYVRPNMIGLRIGSEVVTIVDDPTIPSSYGFYLYDDEGVKAKERTLIQNGVMKDFLHNRETAAELGTGSNAAARSVAYSREPIVRMANTYLKPGDHNFTELIEDIHLGVYIKTFMEWNIDDRRFSQRYVGLEAHRIENGEIKEPVMNPILEITTPNLYNSIDAVARHVTYEAASCGKGDPMQPTPVWHGGPEIRLRRIRLRGR